MKRFMITGDWEIDSSNIDIVEPVITELSREFKNGEYDAFFHLGDVMREFNPYIVAVVSGLLKQFTGRHMPVIILGNHDYDDSGIDRVSAIVGSDAVVIDTPYTHDLEGVQFAMLPAPNRTAFGASRDIETPRERDSSLSTLLETAMLYLKQELITIGRDPADTIFLGHGTLNAGKFGSGLRAAGLTWTIPVEQVSEYNVAFLGHIHQHYTMNDETIVGVGTIAPHTFGDPLMCYAIELIVHDDGRCAYKRIALKRTITPIEFVVTRNPDPNYDDIVIMHGDDICGFMSAASMFDTHSFANRVHNYVDAIFKRNGVVHLANERVALKFRVQLMNAEIASFPRDHDIRDEINSIGGLNVHRVLVTRERTDGPEIRLTEIDASESSRTPLNDYFAQYMDVNNIDARSTIATAAMTILEDEFMSDDWINDASFGIEPISLIVHNFRQWEHFEYTFDANGAIAITGLNALGKSNLLESMIVGLFKRSPASSGRLEDEINHNADKCTIEFVFEASGATYRVRRAIGRKKKGGATCKSELSRLTTMNEADDFWHPVVETATDIDDAIASLIGSYDFVTTTFFRTQRDIDRIVDASPTERHDLGVEAHALTRFDAMRKDANAAKSIDDEKIRSIDSNIATMNTTNARTREQLDAFEEFDVIKTNIELHSSDIVDCETTIDMIRAHIKREHEQSTSLRELRATRNALNNEYDSLTKSVETAKTKFDAMTTRPKPAPFALDSNTLRAECSEFETNRDGIVAGLTVLQRDFDDMKRERENIRATMTANNAAIVRLNRTVERIDETPVDDMPCVEHVDSIGMIRNECPAFAQFADTERRAEFMKEIGDLTESNIARTVELDDINSKIVGSNTDVMKMQKERDEIEKTIRDTHQDMRRALDAENDLSRWESDQSGAEALHESIMTMNKRVDEIAGELLQYAVVDDDIKSVDESIANLTADERKWRNVQQSHERLLETARSQLTRVETYVEQIESLNDRIFDAQTKRDALAIDVAAYTILSNAFNRTGGIPYLIMERSFVAIEHESNRILNECNAGITIEVDTTPETAAGDKRDFIDIRFNDRRGNHPLSSASGYQRAVLGMTLGAAFTRIGAEFWGLTPAFFVQDEGWDRFHSSAYPIARALIDEIARIFTRFYYVTHIEALAGTADHHIRVIERDNAPAFILDGVTKGGVDE